MMTNVNAPIDESYFVWLIGQTVYDGTTPLTDAVYRVLYKTPFVYSVANDYNRAWEGTSLRYEYLDRFSYIRTIRLSAWLELECSILEMLVALSLRAAYQSGHEPSWWFSIFTTNLGITKSPSRTVKTLKVFNSRQYDSDGYGGLFPLNNPDSDQREMELWYQMGAYILENNLY